MNNFNKKIVFRNTIQSKLKFVSINRSYSTKSNNTIYFTDADKDKLEILKISDKKTGIYMWTNNINGKKYIGSSVNLKRRFLEYYNVNRLLISNSMPINTALLKYGYHNFSLTILEFCDISDLMAREKHYFNIYSPEYNILKYPGSPNRGSGWKHSESTLELMRISAIKRSKSLEYLSKLSAAQKSSIEVEMFDIKTNTTTTYHAIQAAARALGLDKRYIENYIYLNQDKPVLGRYTFKLLTSEKFIGVDLNNKIQKTSKKVEVTNVETNEISIYTSISSAARSLGIHQGSISLYLKENRSKPFKGKFVFKYI